MQDIYKKIAHLGPPGTYAEQAALFYLNWLKTNRGIFANLSSYTTIAQSLQAVARKEAEMAVVPVENSIEGSVSMTLDNFWQLENLQIQLALILPVNHTIISCANSLNEINAVYSHPQALAQCQGWLSKFLPHVKLIPANSTTEALKGIKENTGTAAISSSRAAEIYNLPILAKGINDYPDNCTRFWVVSEHNHEFTSHSHTSLAFSLPANLPGVLMKTLQIFADLDINLSRIESRPTKRSLGEYLFFLDIEADINSTKMQSALLELQEHTEILKIFGSYNVLEIDE